VPFLPPRKNIDPEKLRRQLYLNLKNDPVVTLEKRMKCDRLKKKK